MKKELIKTKDYILLLDLKARECKYYLHLSIDGRHQVYDLENNGDIDYFKIGQLFGYCSKIIAYRKLNQEAQDLDLPLLPNPFEEVDIEKLANNKYPVSPQKRKIFIDGYKAAQSKQQLPVSFEPEYETVTKGTNEFDFYEESVIKTTTNSEDKEVVQGNWIY